jgi:hypothetical protein
LEPVEIPYHRTATYTLRIDAPIDAAVQFPEIASANPDLSIRKGEQRTTQREDGQVIEQDYTIDAIRPGAYLLPGQQLDLGAGPLTVPPMALNVRDLSSDERSKPWPRPTPPPCGNGLSALRQLPPWLRWWPGSWCAVAGHCRLPRPSLHGLWQSAG